MNRKTLLSLILAIEAALIMIRSLGSIFIWSQFLQRRHIGLDSISQCLLLYMSV